jgi:Ni/Co efflux regulator RcnB
MNRKVVACTLMALSLSLSQVTFAQRHESGQDVQQNRHPNQMHHNRGHDQRRPQRPNSPLNYEQQAERGAGPEHQFHRGERLPLEYRHKNYVVNDWRAHQLSAPPRGYHWVQIGADYVLVAIASGLILQLMLSN